MTIDNEEVVEDLLHIIYRSDEVTVEQMTEIVTREGFTAAVK